MHFFIVKNAYLHEQHPTRPHTQILTIDSHPSPDQGYPWGTRGASDQKVA